MNDSARGIFIQLQKYFLELEKGESEHPTMKTLSLHASFSLSRLWELNESNYISAFRRRWVAQAKIALITWGVFVRCVLVCLWVCVCECVWPAQPGRVTPWPFPGACGSILLPGWLSVCVHFTCRDTQREWSKAEREAQTTVQYSIWKYVRDVLDCAN